jgi:hypothetical protein
MNGKSIALSSCDIILLMSKKHCRSNSCRKSCKGSLVINRSSRCPYSNTL